MYERDAYFRFNWLQPQNYSYPWKGKKHLYFYSTGSHCLRKKSEPLFIVFMSPLGGKHTQLAEGLALSLSLSLYLKLYKQTAKAIHHNAHVGEKGMGCGENKSI